MTMFIPTAILLISLTTAVDRYESQWRAEIPASDASMSDLMGAVNAASRGQDPWEQALQSVFVAPGPDMAAEGLMQLTEDMAVMCRILDKAVAPIRAQRGTGAAVWLDSSNGVFFHGRSSTQGLYLDGYGALFFIDVDFPLAPPAQQPAEPEAAAGDSVWSATVNELRGVPQERSENPRPQYDASKVENLKTILIKSLRHAANLRTSGAQNAINVVIGTRMGQAGLIGDLFSDELNWWQLSRGDAADGALQTVLILRTSKADVNALAKGELTQEQFAGKVQVLTSWTSAGPQATSGTRSRPTFVVPSRVR